MTAVGSSTPSAFARRNGAFGAVVGAILAVLLSIFLVSRALDVTLFDDPRHVFGDDGAGTAATGVGLLVADALLPVPSSLVMISLGALYGPVVGSLLALAGRFGMAVVGLWLGRAGTPVLTKLIGSQRRDHARALVDRWGAFAIIVSRPVPLLAETVVLAAGASHMRWRVALPAALVGSLPEAIAYGMIGSTAARTSHAVLVWVSFLAVGSLFRLLEVAHRRRVRAIEFRSAVVR